MRHVLNVTCHMSIFGSNSKCYLRYQSLKYGLFQGQPAALSLNTISELKRAPYDIKQLQAYYIWLLLDEFKLLGDLPYHEVLRNGDLVCVHVFKEPRGY